MACALGSGWAISAFDPAFETMGLFGRLGGVMLVLSGRGDCGEGALIGTAEEEVLSWLPIDFPDLEEEPVTVCWMLGSLSCAGGDCEVNCADCAAICVVGAGG